MYRAAVGAASVFMITDALLSLGLSSDRRPAIQAGRALRGAVGVGLGVTALVRKAPKDGSPNGFWLGTLSSIVGGVIVAAALHAGGVKAIAT